MFFCVVRSLAAWVLLLTGCSGGDTDSVVAIPPVDSETWRDTEPGEFPIDTSPDTDRDVVPLHTITFEHWGRWELSPFSGPYTSLVGELQVWEYLDDQRPDTNDSSDTGGEGDSGLACELRYALTGSAIEDASTLCDGCDFGFTVLHFLAEGDLDTCRGAELPEHQQELRMAWSADAQQIYLDLGNSGVWRPWYNATRLGDQLDFAWGATYAVTLDEEEGE